MIKDKIIQKKIKGKVLAVAMTAVMASLFVPVRADAADSVDMTQFINIDANSFNNGNVEISVDSGCMVDGQCIGHKVTAGSSNGYGIKVTSGTHTIALSQANIETEKNKGGISAIDLGESTNVTLILEGGNTLIGDSGYAGIHVPSSARLTIKDTGKDTDKLTAESKANGAGIGGVGYTAANAGSGYITIEGGTIIAKGGDGSNNAAGIGSAGAGKVMEIKINGGTVIAKGGDGTLDANNKPTDGAPGIGSTNGGNIVINNGNVTAIGGKDHGKSSHGDGISGTSLTSGNNGGMTVVKSDRFDLDMSVSTFSGLVWNINRDANGDLKGQIDAVEHGDTCTVYGKAVMPPDFPDDFNTPTDGKPNNLVIRSDATFLIPVGNKQLINDGFITGSGTLINPEMVVPGSGSFSSELTVRVSFDPKSDLTLKDLTYTGDVFSDIPEVFEYKSERTIGTAKYVVDRTGLSYTITKMDDSGAYEEVENIKDAGEYRINFSYGTTPYPVDTKVEPRNINDEGIQMGEIASKDYIGREFNSGDFVYTDIPMSYRGYDLTDKDFNMIPDPTKYEAASGGSIELRGKNNFTGTRTVPFRINQVSLADATVKLRQDKVIYSGEKQEPIIESVEVEVVDSREPDGKKTIQLTGYGKEASTGDNYTDANEIKITITPGSNKNYKDSCEVIYTIEPRTVTVNSITAESRQYKGNAKVSITDMDIDLSATGKNSLSGGGNILQKDINDVAVPTELTGFLAVNGQKIDGTQESVQASPYTQVKLETDMRLGGTKGNNYTVAGVYDTTNTDELVLTEEVYISQADAPNIKLSGEAEQNGNTFNYRLIVTPNSEKDILDPNSIVYYYMGEDVPEKAELDKWKQGTLDNLVYSGIPPCSEQDFYLYINENVNVAGTEIVHWHDIMPKLTRTEKPSSCTLTAIPNDDGETYTLQVEPAQTTTLEQTLGVYIYSFDSEGSPESYTYSDRLEYAEPNTEYTAWVKFAEDDNYKASEEGTSATIKTDPREAKKPDVTYDGTVQNEGEISFYGTAEVSITYSGNLNGVDVFYTTDGMAPTSGSQKSDGKPITVEKDTVIKAIAIKEGVATSAVTEVTLKKAGENNPNNPDTPSTGMDVELQRLNEQTAPELLRPTDLPAKGIDTFDAVSTPLASPILQQRGYENNNITYADLKIKIRGTNRYATEEDFRNAAGGVIRVTVTMDQLVAIGLPSSYDGTNHNFAVTHMFATGTQAGNVETIGTAHNFSKSQDGKSISFDMTSTSPVAFGWADVNNSDPNPIDPGTDDPGNQDPGNQDPGNQDPGNQDPGTQDPNTIVGEGDPRQAAQGTQGTGTTTGTSAGTQGASNDAANALSGIMPKTGDPLSFVPWIAAIVISVGAIAFFATRKKDKKKQTVKKTQAAKKKK